MGEASAAVVWLGASGFRVLEVDVTGVEVVVSIETEPEPVGCALCGVRAKSKDRRWVTLRDAPSGDRPVTVRWHKRISQRPEPSCSSPSSSRTLVKSASSVVRAFEAQEVNVAV